MEAQGCITISCFVASDKTLSDMMSRSGAFALASEVFASAPEDPVVSLPLSPLLLKELLEPAVPIYCLR